MVRITRLLCIVASDPLAFPLVVDTYFLQPPISTSGETASTLQVFPKGPVVSVEPSVCPCANKWLRCQDRNHLDGMSRWFPSKIEIQKWIEDQEKDFVEAQNKNTNLSTEDYIEIYIFTDIHEIFFGGIH